MSRVIPDESRTDESEESTYQPLVLVPEGQYELTPVRSGQHWYMVSAPTFGSNLPLFLVTIRAN